MSSLRLGLALLWRAAGAALVAGAAARAELAGPWKAWNEPAAPLRVAGNIHYVGTADLACYLIATPAGHILVDGGLAESAPLVRAGIAQLGFRIEDVRILLSTHAHADHAGGLAELKRLSGARLLAGAADAPRLAAGGKGDFHWGDALPFPPVAADAVLADGDAVELGGTRIVAHATPGHTRGNLTFTLEVEEAGRRLAVVIAGSATAPGYRLRDNPVYPEIADDFRRSIARLKTLPCDVFLAPHGHVFRLAEKRQAPVANHPFVDPEGYRRWVAQAEAALEAQLAP